MHKIEFNIGDTVICKKDYITKNLATQSFITNTRYIIEDSTYWDEEKDVIIYQIKNWSFISTNKVHNLHLPNLSDYFYTKKEIRKMKINKINNERD